MLLCNKSIDNSFLYLFFCMYELSFLDLVSYINIDIRYDMFVIAVAGMCLIIKFSIYLYIMFILRYLIPIIYLIYYIYFSFLINHSGSKTLSLHYANTKYLVKVKVWKQNVYIFTKVDYIKIKKKK